METPKKVQYRAKFDSIFQQIGKATNSIWKVDEMESSFDHLWYKTTILGQEASVRLEFVKEKVVARVFAGSYQRDRGNLFTNEISFSLKKDESKILKDLLERLEVDSLDEKITKLLEKRKEREQHLTNLKYKNEVFKRMLPFDDKGYRNHLSLKLKPDFIIELDTLANRMEIRADTDLMVKICGKIAELLNQ